MSTRARVVSTGSIAVLAIAFLAGPASGQRNAVADIAAELVRQAETLAGQSFEHFRGRNGTISDKEQAVLFKSEAFAASCRLFLRLSGSSSDYFPAENLRTNVYNAFLYLAASFGELEAEMKRGGVAPYGLGDCRRLLNRMEQEFRRWPDADNLAYLDGKYVKARDATVYLIERKALGRYERRPFKSLESLFRYNYDARRGKDPWAFLVEVSEETLEKMRTGAMIELTFEGRMIIEQGTRANRPVYLIENGRRRGLTRPQLVDKFGGWGRVFEVPREVVAAYPEGEPIQ